ncbi:MAG TPA: pantoate--beta-alanine ligase, partial [Gaiellales bacterium]|nr:pantoate--beta-alanine ligase [Gaiellales bacterium]
LVPTMGALHGGHRALLRTARGEADRVVMSLFVNPGQFAPGEDFERYPRDEQADRAVASVEGVDDVYMPTIEEMYPPGFSTAVSVGSLGEVFEGVHRPGHFVGVATVVLKLLLRLRPDRAYFGRKDAQQLAVVRRMVLDLDLNVVIRAVDTVREHDGLAMSSRNVYLDPVQRRRAASLHRALLARDPGLVEGELDYLAVVDPDTFQEVSERPGMLVVGAARFGSTRLIDNVVVEEP